MADAPNTDRPFLETVDALMRKYADQVSSAELSESSKSIYIDFANCFVRWIHGDFLPGKVGAWKRPKYAAKQR